MQKIRIGITGESGFIGSHMAGMIRSSNCFERIPFFRDFFEDASRLRQFAEQCDVIVHLAAVSRAENGETLYAENMRLTQALANAAPRGICFASTVQIHKDQPYHASKRDGAALLNRLKDTWTVDMLMPNVFGPGSRPFYNSVISTFCRQAADGEIPAMIGEVTLQLSYVDDLCRHILNSVQQGYSAKKSFRVVIPHQYEEYLPDIWEKLHNWSRLEPDDMPELKSRFDCDLWNTFQSYTVKEVSK